MDFDFTPEQVMLRDLVREFLSRQCPPTFVRRMMDDPTGFDEGVWRQLAEIGLHGVAIDEQYGGQGLGMVELALVAEEMGRAVYPGPYFASVVLAASAIAASGDTTQMGAYLPGIASGEIRATLALIEDAVTWGPESVGLTARPDGVGFVLSGIKRFVPFAQVADVILVAARTNVSDDPSRGVTVFLIEHGAPGLTMTPERGIDLTSKSAALRLDDVRVSGDAVLGDVGQGWPILDATLQRASVAASAEMLGAARKSLEMSVEYASTREQFGQPIGMFQAIKHTCAEMLLEVENCHGATYYGAWALDAGIPEAALAASVAKSYVSLSARKVCGSAIQVHGGIGFTWDFDLHLLFKRAKYLEPLYGDAEFHRERAVSEALARSAVPVDVRAPAAVSG